MIWPFRKAPRLPQGPVPDWPPARAPEDRRGWNEDWRVGDLAECIATGWNPPMPDDPRHGQVLRVSALTEGVTNDGQAIVSALGFVGRPPHIFWACCAFRKIRPAEAEFTAELRERLKLGEPA